MIICDWSIAHTQCVHMTYKHSMNWLAWPTTRACLDQLLIAIRSLLIVCDHVQSKERLIAINKPIAKLGMIYTTRWWHDGILSIKCHCRHLANYKHTVGRAGRWAVSESVAAAAAARAVGPPLIDNRIICCPSCHPLLDRVSVSHCSTLTDKFPEDDPASANTTAWKVAK